jgi:uncharacterized membrane protein YkvA (DUF1232 family)
MKKSKEVELLKSEPVTSEEKNNKNVKNALELNESRRLSNQGDEQEGKKIYDLLRSKVRKSVANYFGDKYKNVVEYILLIPDFFMLLWRLMRDKDVSKNKKLFIGAIIAYVLLPIDLIPDFIPIIGFLDDLVLIAIGLDSIFARTDKEILQKHWSGEGEVLEKIQSIIKLGNDILSNRIIGKITRWVEKRAG